MASEKDRPQPRLRCVENASLNGERLRCAVLIVLDVRPAMGEVPLTLLTTTRWSLLVVESLFRFAVDFIDFLDLITIFVAYHRLPCDRIDYVAQRIDDLLHLVGYQAGGTFGELSYQHHVAGFALLLGVVGEQELILIEILEEIRK